MEDKLRLRPENLDPVTAVGLPVFGTVDRSAMVQTLDPTGAAQE
jgi:hypothetical protein